MYSVTAYDYSMANGVRQTYTERVGTSSGFGSREAAERFAAGLAAAGKCVRVEIEDDDDE